MRIKKFMESSPALAIVTSGQQLAIKMNKHLDGESLNFLQALILISIFFEPEKKVRPKEFPNTFHTTKGNISHCLAHLEKEKLITRKITSNDGRGFFIVLTPAGEAVCLGLIKYFDELQRKTEELLGEAAALRLVAETRAVENLFSVWGKK